MKVVSSKEHGNEVEITPTKRRISVKGQILSYRLSTVKESQNKCQSKVSTSLDLTELSHIPSPILVIFYILVTSEIIQVYNPNHPIVVINLNTSRLLGILVNGNS